MTIKRAWAFQLDFIRKTFNKEIYHWFKDIDPDVLPDNTNGRQAARAACLIGAKDDKLTVNLKLLTFSKLQESTRLVPMVAGVPYQDVDEAVKYHPKISLFFLQDPSSLVNGDKLESGVISFRLTNKTSQTITEGNLRELATEIKTQFSAGSGYLWRKGKVMVTTRDQKIGLPQKILCLNESEGIEIYQKIFAILDKPYDADLLNVKEPKKSSVTNPLGSALILGKRVKEKKWRPVTTVRFQYALAKIHGIVSPIPLVDRTKTFYHAFEYS